MGLFGNYEGGNSASENSSLDLIDFEKSLLTKLNDDELLSTKYMAEDIGLAYDKTKKRADIYSYDVNEVITICPEPLTFIKDFDDVSDNKLASHSLFVEKINSFQQIKLSEMPTLKENQKVDGRMWLNKTLTGINLRPGNLNDDRSKFIPIKMCDDNVHGLIVGRTGSGKSVYINALILSLITEYPPWELDLYLADFKKVELSRYMNDSDEENGHVAFTPHVKACAATSEIRYVTSMIKHLVACMNARNEFFTRLGVTKIQEFRDKYNLVLPRVLIMVDEFQQLFTEATSQEKDEIQVMLNAIAKLGRATGFHLIFASQEMSGTLRGNTLANFKIRMTLPCNPQISVDILGNNAAAELERGYVLINTESGDKDANKKYRVPFIETEKKDEDDNLEKTPFFKYLDEIKCASRKFDLSYKYDIQKFYREELQEKEKSYINDLDRIKDKKNTIIKKRNDLFDAIILGKTVLYSEQKNDKVSFYLERGRNKGVMIASPNTDDVAEIRKLLVENLLRSDDEISHIGLELNNLVFERYRMDKYINLAPKQSYVQHGFEDGLKVFSTVYFLRKYSMTYLTKKENQNTLLDLKKLDSEISNTLSNANAYNQYREYITKKKELISEISLLEEKSKQSKNEIRIKINNPIIEFLTLCSSAIIIIPKTNQKADFEGLKIYKDIINSFGLNLDIANASIKNLKLIESKLKELEKSVTKNGLAIIQLKVLKRAIMHFDAIYNGERPDMCPFTEQFDSYYEKISNKVVLFKKQYEKRNKISTEKVDIAKNIVSKENQLEELIMTGNNLDELVSEVKNMVNDYVVYCYSNAYTSMGFKKKSPHIPLIDISLNNGEVEFQLMKNNNESVEESNNLSYKYLDNILKVFRKKYTTNEINVSDYHKVVLWINGLDEVDKMPNYAIDIIRDAINYNILAIAIITSELKDSTIRKAFDYAFITGNVEKFYSMFNIKYTKQPLDSIVVNFGIRSKGFNIPFKMYKSELEEVQIPDFIQYLLEE